MYLCQDDAHIFCLPEQIRDEIRGVLDLTEDVLKQFGFSRFEINLSTRPEKSVGSDEIWEKSTMALKDALEDKGWDYGIDEGGGAFYGPKIDIKIEDAIGRKWQCSTIQVCPPVTIFQPGTTRLLAALAEFLYLKFNYPVLPIPPIPIIYFKSLCDPRWSYEVGCRSRKQDLQIVRLIISYSYTALCISISVHLSIFLIISTIDFRGKFPCSLIMSLF